MYTKSRIIIRGGSFTIMTVFLDSINRLITLEEELTSNDYSVEVYNMVIEACYMTLLKGEEMKDSLEPAHIKSQYEEAASAYISSLNHLTCEEIVFKAKRVLSFKQYECEHSLLTS